MKKFFSVRLSIIKPLLKLMIGIFVILSSSSPVLAQPEKGVKSAENSEMPMPTVIVDSTLTTLRKKSIIYSLGSSHPVATMIDPTGHQVDFIADEMILATDDPLVLNNFLSKWNGKEIKTIKFPGNAFKDVPTWHVVQLDPLQGDHSHLSQDLRSIELHSYGEHRVSSKAGLGLLSIIASTAARNPETVSLDFLVQPFAEAPEGEDAPGGDKYTPNPDKWSYIRKDSEQGIGVNSAWRHLEQAGRLGNEVEINIVDFGFVSPFFNLDYPPSAKTTIIGSYDRPNQFNCASGYPCPWHGTSVANAATGVRGNNIGAVGPAGPVAKAVLLEINTEQNLAGIVGYIVENIISGLSYDPQIVNMSFGFPVSRFVRGLALPIDGLFYAWRQTGTLIFAGAGNDGIDLDATDCWAFICWKRTYVLPCENAGVICVGGLKYDKKDRHQFSNYGSGVDIFGPFGVWVGADREKETNHAKKAQFAEGTSFSSPFVAGVAALIWAADPSLSPKDVEDILISTAHTNPDDKTVSRYVNADAAVLKALGQ
jgi:serine protease